MEMKKVRISKYLWTPAGVGRVPKNLEMSSDTKAEEVPINNSRGRRSGHCYLP